MDEYTHWHVNPCGLPLQDLITQTARGLRELAIEAFHLDEDRMTDTQINAHEEARETLEYAARLLESFTVISPTN